MTASRPRPSGDGGSNAGLESGLREALLSGTVMSSTPAYEVDGVRPSVVAIPGSAAEVAAALRAADERGAAVIPRGAGSEMALGMPPQRHDVALDLGRLDGIVEYEPADLTVTVQAGAKLADVQRRLAENGQWLPLDPPCRPSATIGGVLATNASGPSRIAFGTARDLVIGMTVALADGQVVKSGGRVVKNVAGYDMAKMHIGALGTLGVIVQATFKVAPLPKASRTLSIAGADTAALTRLAFAVRDGGLPATGIALAQPLGTSAARLLLRFAGSLAAVDRSCLHCERLASEYAWAAEPESIWQELASARSPDAGAVVRISHQPSMTGTLLAGIASLNGDILSYPSVGMTYARVIALPEESYEAVRALRATAEAGGGALVLEAAPPNAKQAIGVWGSPRADFELMRRLKAELDPRATLNPGRFVGGI